MNKILLTLLFLFLSAAAADDAREANEAYENGNYEQAIELYQRAIEQDPENAKLHFNLASALHKAGRTEDAMNVYDQFEQLSDSPQEQSFASYNQGTMLTEEDKYEEAVDFFREALEKNPNDPDARHNYELAIRRQQQQEEQQEQQQNQDSGQNDEQENQDQQQNQDGNNNQQQNPNQDQQQSGGGQEDQEQQNEENQQQPQPTEMSPEEAQNILDALKQLERQLLENMKKESSETPPTNEKDW